MSADEVLAANLWPWPDPLLKRDRDGQVLFVNAAFLQLYGGRIEDWRGNVIAGWPAPGLQGAQRFETRAGEAPHEMIYDWVEMMMADGNAMAIARNVTALIPAPTPPANVSLPPLQATETPPAANIVESTPTPETVVTPPPVAPPAQEPAPALSAETPKPVAEPEDEACELEDTLNRSAADYLDTPTVQETPAPDAPQPTQADVDAAEEAEMTRKQERRALPIEDSSSILGSNWRDQVIAKAIGAEEPEDENETTPEEPAATASSSTPDASGTSQQSVGLKILLAEDNAINALLTRTLLEAEGAVVDTVEDGALAVEAVKKQAYDLIFMDMRMPNMDGLEATRKIRALGGAAATLPIVALTANAFDDDRNACFDSGMNDFMTKPVSAEELEEMVANWTKKDAEKLAS